ncbi:hypothetical protein GCM10023184_20380 [Flaviaesturariibacter amylovorans]|uniref:Uncharacterized protein n=2 Tax=Flaviaesturariibacter amylovorans TaxID=1084520 RepID=A0ABP8GTM6_9BACT
MRYQGAALVHSPVSKRGIIDLEFAWTEARFAELMALWKPWEVTLNFYLDFLFIVAYTWFFWTAARHMRARFRKPAVPGVFAALALAAGGLDVVENGLLLFRVLGGSGTWALQGAALAAALKFAALAAVAAFLLWTAVSRRNGTGATIPAL